MELTDTQLREKFQQWGKSSGVITDFAKCAPLPVSGARLYSRETNIAWQAFRDAYWSGHREAVLASIPEMGSGEQRFDARIGKLCTHRPAPAPAPALCHCYVDAPPHTHEPIPESATMQERFIAADAGCTVEEVRQAFAEPIPQDDAAVVGEMQQAYIRGTQSPMHIACTTDSCCTAGMESALAVARRGMVTLEAVEKAVRFEYAAPRLLTTADIFTHAVLARLAQDGKPHTYTGKVPYLDEVVTLRALVERLYEALENLIDGFRHNPLCECKNCKAKAVLIAARKQP